MGTFRHIAINGELGSGKSAVSSVVSDRLSLPVVSIGRTQREIAASLGLSSLEANLYAERETTIDQRLDDELRTIGRGEQSTIFDSRMAWHFVPGALKVHLVAEPTVSARRALSSRSDFVERYESAEDARDGLDRRASSERTRFQDKYNVDIARLRNYDLVIDTSDASVETVADELIDAFVSGNPGAPLRVSPRRVIPTGDCGRYLSSDPPELRGDPLVDYPVLGYARPFFFALRDYGALSKAVTAGRPLTPAGLEVEGTDEVVGALTAEEYLKNETERRYIYDWEDIHGIRFETYPDEVWNPNMRGS